SVEGKEVNAANELQMIVGSHHPGETVKLNIFRDGKTIDKEITLKAITEDNKPTGMNNQKKEDESGKSGAATTTIKSLGVGVADLTSAQKDKLGISEGIVVTSVDKYSDAFMRGLAQGMVIV